MSSIYLPKIGKLFPSHPPFRTSWLNLRTPPVIRIITRRSNKQPVQHYCTTQWLYTQLPNKVRLLQNVQCEFSLMELEDDRRHDEGCTCQTKKKKLLALSTPSCDPSTAMIPCRLFVVVSFFFFVLHTRCNVDQWLMDKERSGTAFAKYPKVFAGTNWLMLIRDIKRFSQCSEPSVVFFFFLMAHIHGFVLQENGYQSPQDVIFCQPKDRKWKEFYRTIGTFCDLFCDRFCQENVL